MAVLNCFKDTRYRDRFKASLLATGSQHRLKTPQLPVYLNHKFATRESSTQLVMVMVIT